VSILEPINEWLETWANPIVDCLYARDRAAAEQWLADARLALSVEDTLDADQRKAGELKLHYFEYQINKALGDRDEWGRAFGEAIVAIGQPVETEAADVMQRILLCLLRSSGMRAGFRDFAVEEFNALFDGIPEDERTSELWHTVANWAFHRRDVENLGRAFEFFTISADGWLSDYTWQHVNCMYQLVAGKAIKKDVVELIKRITLTPQMDNFNKHIWPMVIELGLRDDEVEALRQEYTDRIQREGAYVPRKELKTKTTVRPL
jgi:hypothetical protein